MLLILGTISWLTKIHSPTLAVAGGQLNINPSLIWLIAGSVLCLLELSLPTAFTAFTMGLAAIIVAVFAWYFPAQFGLQIFLWMVLATGGIIATRRLLPKTKTSILSAPKQAETLTEILPGKAGRVIYESNSWRAICEDETVTIAAHQKVYVVRREGTTLIVVPEYFVLGE